MSDLYLVCHKVRGEAAFDIATRMVCPICLGDKFAPLKDGEYNGGCLECDSEGFWWIIPTSGHRAYPWYWAELPEDFVCSVPDMPPNLPDHYPHSAEPAKPRIDLSSLLAKRPPTPIRRRR